MLSRTTPDKMDLSASDDLPRSTKNLISRKIWLPKVLYDGLPYFYMFAGVSALIASLYIGAWYWVVPHYILFSAGCLHLCFIVFRRRRTRDLPTSQTENQP